MTQRTNWDGTPRDIDVVHLLSGGELEIGSRNGDVTLQQVGSRGGLEPVHRPQPQDADTLADALRRRTSDARGWRDARGGGDAE